MKKVFPITMALGLAMSVTVLNPVSSSPLQKEQTTTSKPFAYESDGVLNEAIGGPVNWHITWGSTNPYQITFSRPSTGESWGPYAYTSQGGGVYVAAGPRQALGVIQCWVNNGVVSFTTLL